MASLLFLNNNRFVKAFKNSLFIEIENMNDGKKEQTNIYFINNKGKIIDTLKKPYISPITGVFNIKINDDLSDTINHIKVDIDDDLSTLTLTYNIENGLQYVSKSSKIICRKLLPIEIEFLKNKKMDKITILK